MQVKRTISEADRRRLRETSEASSDSDVGIPEELSMNEKLLSSFGEVKKRKIAVQEPLLSDTTSFQGPPKVLDGDTPAIDESQLQLLAIESRRLDFEVNKWKQQQALRRETLQLKSEEITLKEATTKQKQEAQIMELRAKILKVLDETGIEPELANKYFALLQG